MKKINYISGEIRIKIQSSNTYLKTNKNEEEEKFKQTQRNILTPSTLDQEISEQEKNGISKDVDM